MPDTHAAKGAKGREDREQIEAIARDVVDAAIKVHKALGPGLLEGVYERCLAIELEKRGLGVKRQLVLPVQYEGEFLEAGFRVDLLVDDLVVIEIKSVEKLQPVHLAQVMTYLRIGEYKLGFLLNFYVPLMKDGIKRVVNKL